MRFRVTLTIAVLVTVLQARTIHEGVPPVRQKRVVASSVVASRVLQKATELRGDGFMDPSSTVMEPAKRAGAEGGRLTTPWRALGVLVVQAHE